MRQPIHHPQDGRPSRLPLAPAEIIPTPIRTAADRAAERVSLFRPYPPLSKEEAARQARWQSGRAILATLLFAATAVYTLATSAPPPMPVQALVAAPPPALAQEQGQEQAQVQEQAQEQRAEAPRVAAQAAVLHSAIEINEPRDEPPAGLAPAPAEPASAAIVVADGWLAAPMPSRSAAAEPEPVEPQQAEAGTLAFEPSEDSAFVAALRRAAAEGYAKRFAKPRTVETEPAPAAAEPPAPQAVGSYRFAAHAPTAGPEERRLQAVFRHYLAPQRDATEVAARAERRLQPAAGRPASAKPMAVPERTGRTTLADVASRLQIAPQPESAFVAALRREGANGYRERFAKPATAETLQAVSPTTARQAAAPRSDSES